VSAIVSVTMLVIMNGINFEALGEQELGDQIAGARAWALPNLTTSGSLVSQSGSGGVMLA